MINRLVFLALLLQLVQFSPIASQEFSFHSVSPFGIQTMHADSSRTTQKVMFFDYDKDGDLDLFHSGIDAVASFDSWDGLIYYMEMQENTGDRSNPQFGPRTEVFTDFPFPLGYFIPAIGDVNRDGYQDFVAFGDVNYFGNRTTRYLQSTSQNQFEVIPANTFDLKDFVPESFFIPELVDLDGDGDLDMLMSGFNPAFAEEDGPDIPTYYYGRNQGLPSSVPTFEGWYTNPYDLVPNPLIEVLTSGDINNDGFVDLLGTPLLIPQDSLNHIYVHLNAPGVNNRPSFASTLVSPFNLPTTFGESQLFFPALVDLDGDGDLDLFVFKGNPNGTTLEYYENNLCTVTSEEVAMTICQGDVLEYEGQEYSVPGIYVIHTFDDNGCAHIVTLFLDLEIMPVIDLEETICAGEQVQVGNELFTAAGEYVVTLQASSGCDSVVLLHLQVIEVDNTINFFENTLIANLSGATYQWINCDSGENIPGANGQSYEAQVTGNYAVLISDGSDCISQSECIHVNITATHDETLSSNLSMYPNPAKDVVYVMNDSPLPVSSIKIINISGQVIREIDMKGSASFDITFLQTGIYFVKMEMDGHYVIKKLIVM